MFLELLGLPRRHVGTRAAAFSRSPRRSLAGMVFCTFTSRHVSALTTGKGLKLDTEEVPADPANFPASSGWELNTWLQLLRSVGPARSSAESVLEALRGRGQRRQSRPGLLVAVMRGEVCRPLPPSVGSGGTEREAPHRAQVAKAPRAQDPAGRHVILGGRWHLTRSHPTRGRNLSPVAGGPWRRQEQWLGVCRVPWLCAGHRASVCTGVPLRMLESKALPVPRSYLSSRRDPAPAAWVSGPPGVDGRLCAQMKHF